MCAAGTPNVPRTSPTYIFFVLEQKKNKNKKKNFFTYPRSFFTLFGGFYCAPAVSGGLRRSPAVSGGAPPGDTTREVFGHNRAVIALNLFLNRKMVFYNLSRNRSQSLLNRD